MPSATSVLLPRVSIGVPVYNGENYLATALDSLLAQTYSDFEIIISDNASTDKTALICQDYTKQDSRVRYFRQPKNVGAAGNFNRTVALARGEYFKWHAHDDLCAPTFLERCVAVLDTNPDAVLCIPKTRFIDDQGQPVHDYDHPINLDEKVRSERFLQFIFQEHIVVEVFGIIRTNVLRKTPLIGSYMGSDLVLLGDLALRGTFIEVPEFLFYHREHQQRSVYTHLDAKARTAWFDTSKSDKSALPTWCQLREHMLSLLRVPLPFSERVRLAVGLLRRVNWHRQRFKNELLAVVMPQGLRQKA